MRGQDAPPPDEKHRNGHGVRNVQQDGARRDVCAKGNRRAEVQQSEADVEEVAEEDCAHGHIELGLDV